VRGFLPTPVRPPQDYIPSLKKAGVFLKIIEYEGKMTPIQPNTKLQHIIRDLNAEFGYSVSGQRYHELLKTLSRVRDIFEEVTIYLPKNKKTAPLVDKARLALAGISFALGEGGELSQMHTIEDRAKQNKKIQDTDKRRAKTLKWDE